MFLMEEDKFQLTLAIRPKVGIIYSYLKENNLTLKKLAEIIGVNPNWLCSIVNFRYIPKTHDGENTQKLLNFFDAEFSDIFPTENLKLIAGEHQVSKTIPKDKLINWSREQFDMLPAPEIEEEKIDIKTTIENALEKLKPREKEILEMRFGLNGKREYSLLEIAKYMNVTQERIRQIESKAFRKLRHPLYSKKLKDLL